jgi:hypothetical protein
LDGFSVVVFHGCPLTLMEQKYLNINSSIERTNEIKNCKILYNCDHEYEKTIEIIINAWLLISIKCLLILFFKVFNIKLQNYNNIYE